MFRKKLKAIEFWALCFDVLTLIAAIILCYGIRLSRTVVRDSELRCERTEYTMPDGSTMVRCLNCDSMWNESVYIDSDLWMYCPMCGGEFDGN